MHMNRSVHSLAAFFLVAFFLVTPDTGWAQAPSERPLKPSVDETARSLLPPQWETSRCTLWPIRDSGPMT